MLEPAVDLGLPRRFRGRGVILSANALRARNRKSVFAMTGRLFGGRRLMRGAAACRLLILLLLLTEAEPALMPVRAAQTARVTTG